MVAGRRRISDAPPVVPARFGLLSAASVLDRTDSEGRSGYRFQPDACGPATSYGDNCPGVEDRTKVIEPGVPEVAGDTFVVYAGINCSPVGWTRDEMTERARNALTLGEGRAIEAAFWTGALDNGELLRPRLAEDGTEPDEWTDTQLDAMGPTAVDVAGGGIVGVGLGLALLEEAMGGCYGGRPILHMPLSVALIASGLGYVERDGANLATTVGSLVAAGGGYPGTGPGSPPVAHATNTRWIYATGNVVVERWPIEPIPPIAQTLDRGVNTELLIAERVVSVGWDCCLFAVEVDLTENQGALP